MSKPEADFYLRNLFEFNEMLELAMEVNTPEAARDLLELDAIPQVRDANSALLLSRVLHLYVGREATLQEVVGGGAKERNLRSLLHVASAEGHAAIVRLLLEWGADPSEYDELQRSALHIGAAHGHRAVVQALLEYGADVRALHSSGKNALHFGAEGSDDVVLVKMLLDRGLDVNGTDIIHRSTPLQLAAWKGRWQVVRLLLERGADIYAANGQGCTAVHLGARYKRVLEQFLKQGADLKCLDARKLTPLMWLEAQRNTFGPLFQEVRMIISHLMMDVALGVPIDSCNAHCIESNNAWRRLRNECVEEIEMLKKKKCFRNMTYFEIFSSSVSELAKCVRNRALSHTLRNIDFEEQFSIYGQEMKEKIIKAHEAKAHSHRVVHFVQKSLGDCLPIDVTFKIGQYLTPKDIRFK